MEPNVTDIPEVPEYQDLHLDNAWNGPSRERFLSSMAVNNREPDLGSQGTGATRARVIEEMIDGAANILYDSIRDSTSPDITALETHVNKTFETIFSFMKEVREANESLAHAMGIQYGMMGDFKEQILLLKEDNANLARQLARIPADVGGGAGPRLP